MSIFRTKPKLVAAGMAAAMAAGPAAALASAGTTTANWQIPLKGSAAYPAANGSAQYQSQPGQREVQVEVQHIRSLAGKTVAFSVAGVTLGSAKVSTLGRADITRNTDARQKVPSIVHGSIVRVRSAGGVLIVSGKF